MKEQRHIVFDLETLGNGPTAPIIQIGAVEIINGKIFSEFEVNVHYSSFEGFTPDYSTIMYWLGQSQEARETIFQGETLSLKDALSHFKDWAGDTTETIYWSMLNFDAPILSHAFRQCGITGFPYWQFKDFRTIIDLAGIEKGEFEGIKHNALDDAKHEAKLIIKALEKLC